MDFCRLLSNQQKIIYESYTSNKEIFDFAVDAWEAFIVDNYFDNPSEYAALVMMYKTQADAALFRAITSILRKEYPQAIYNTRYANENIGIAIFAYAKPERMKDLFKSKKSTDQMIKKAAIDYMESELSQRSAKLKSLHEMCNKFGSHQTISHHSSNFAIDKLEKQFTITMQGEDRPEMNVGLTGIILGLILEFHYAISEIGKVGHIDVNDEVNNRMQKVERNLTKMQKNY